MLFLKLSKTTALLPLVIGTQATLWSNSSASNQSFISTLSTNAQSLFNTSMAWMDYEYDEVFGYLYGLGTDGGAVALRHDTRLSSWYAVGLLARNQGDDVFQAERIVRNVIGGQYKNVSDQWYATYQKEPEEPTVGSLYYPELIYNSWDPNWRGFVGTAFIIMLEEFPDLVSSNLTSYILESLYNNTVGDSYRVGGVDDDNLYPSYSNPSIMRAFVAGWTGRRLNVANMTQSGENYATAIVELFDRSNTLSEFNSGTYAGVSMFALTLWAKYMPSDSVMGQNGALMLKHTWESITSLYHAGLKNVAGPWDRTYGYDMNKYLSILSLHIWAYLGQEIAPISNRPVAMSHSSDFAIAPMIAILSPFANTLVDSIGSNVTSAFSTFPGEHTVATSAFSPPFDLYPRNISAWLADSISIGGEQFNETVIGGPSTSSSSFNPGVIQWDTGYNNQIGHITLYSTEKAATVIASPGKLNITYPYGNSSSIVTLLVSPFLNQLNVDTWDDLPGLAVAITGNINMTYQLSFCGKFGGSCFTINDFEFWNFTYTMPVGSDAIPNLLLEVEMK